MATLDRETDERPGREHLGGRGGHDEQREDQQRAGDLARLGDGDPEHHEEHDRESAHGNAVGGGDVGVDRGEQQRTADDRDRDESRDRRPPTAWRPGCR